MKIEYKEGLIVLKIKMKKSVILNMLKKKKMWLMLFQQLFMKNIKVKEWQESFLMLWWTM